MTAPNHSAVPKGSTSSPRDAVADASWPPKAGAAHFAIGHEMAACFEEEPSLVIEAPGPPVPKRRARVYIDPEDNKIHARTPGKSKKYEGHLANLARIACLKQRWPVGGWKARGVRYAVLVDAVLEADEGDADNLAKSWKDALNRIVWPDDRRVCLLWVARRVAASGEAPRATCRVWALGTKE